MAKQLGVPVTEIKNVPLLLYNQAYEKWQAEAWADNERIERQRRHDRRNSRSR